MRNECHGRRDVEYMSSDIIKRYICGIYVMGYN